MTCKTCNVEMDEKLVELEDEYRGETLTVSATGYVCPQCNGDWFGLDDVAEYGRHVADAYRRKHRLLTSNDIREARERLGMSQEAFARFLDVGAASVKRWEWGLVQDRSLDKLIRVLTDPNEAEQAARKARALMAAEHAQGSEDTLLSTEAQLPIRTFMFVVPKTASRRQTRLKVKPTQMPDFRTGPQKHVRIHPETELPDIPIREMR
jgi:putative zinc finger/helix-turn-helix YgiT family protein